MSNLVRYSQSRERARRLGPTQILDVNIPAQVVSETGNAYVGASAQGAATKIAFPAGRCVAGSLAQGSATKIATTSGNAVGGSLAQGTAAKIVAISGNAVAGSLARGAAVKVVAISSNSFAGSLAQGSATKVALPIGPDVAGASAQGAATKTAISSGTDVAGALTQGAATKTASSSGTNVAGALAQGTASKLIETSGIGVAGALAQGTATKSVDVSGTGVTGSLAQGLAEKEAATSGTSAAGSSAQGEASGTRDAAGGSYAGALARGVATPAGTAAPTGLSAARSMAYGATEKTAIPEGVSADGASAEGVAEQTVVVAPVGVCVGGASARAVYVGHAPYGRCEAGGSAFGSVGEIGPPIVASGSSFSGSSAYGTAVSGVREVDPMTAADFFVGPLMTELLACLCETSAQAANPPAICCFRVGTEIVHDAGLNEDQCCRGIAYVSLGDTYPASQSFPEQDIVRQASAKCGPPTWAQVFKIGIIRCAPIGDGFNAIHCDEWNAAAVQNVIDSATLRHVSCCFRDYVINNQERYLGMSLVIERQSQGNPLGGCIERSLTMVAQIPNDCEC